MTDKRINNQAFIQKNAKTDQWEYKRSNAERASATASTKKEILEKAIPMAKNQNLELNIKKQDGKISEKRSYGNDPFPPKDKK